MRRLNGSSILTGVTTFLLITALATSCMYHRARPDNNWGEIIRDSMEAVVVLEIHEGIGPNSIRIGGGTGWLISADGKLVTNAHVVSLTERLIDPYVWAVFHDDRRFIVNDIKRYDRYDIATAQISVENEYYLRLEEEYGPKAGDEVVSLGNAFPFVFTPSAGIISSIINTEDMCTDESCLPMMMIMSAVINPGCSGGPVLNSRGKVIGVNVAYAPTHRGIYAAVPLTLVKEALEILDSA